ncbi:MAG: hypothetical protein R2697_17110 [Ilumatobacteraceae bacterium]
MPGLDVRAMKERTWSDPIRSDLTFSCVSGSVTNMDVVNTVQMVGEVRERPFRPGDGNRVVVKIRVHDDESGRFDNVEFDSFGAVGDFAIRLFSGDRIAVRGRLEGLRLRRRRRGQDRRQPRRTRAAGQ